MPIFNNQIDPLTGVNLSSINPCSEVPLVNPTRALVEALLDRKHSYPELDEILDITIVYITKQLEKLVDDPIGFLTKHKELENRLLDVEVELSILKSESLENLIKENNRADILQERLDRCEGFMNLAMTLSNRVDYLEDRIKDLEDSQIKNI